MLGSYRGRARGFSPSDAAMQEIERIFDIWNASLSTSPGPVLFSKVSIADCMYVPILTRFRTYGVPVEGDAAAWEARIWEQPSVAKWARLAEQSIAVPKYDALL